MSDAELDAFLHEQRTVICATIDRDGAPHLMPLWYLVREGELWAWTYAASQKVRNLERDARATLAVEAGEHYDELRGVMLRTEAVIASMSTGIKVRRSMISASIPLSRAAARATWTMVP